MAGFIRRFREVPPLSVIQQIEGVVITDEAPPGTLTGAGTGKVILLGEFEDGPFASVAGAAGGYRNIFGTADQIATYAWMLGVPVGDQDMIVGLDQLACKPSPDVEANRMPLIRVAQHRCRISKGWQEGLLKRYQSCWEAIQSGHIFDDMTREESDARCEVLDMTQPESDDLWDMINVREFRG